MGLAACDSSLGDVITGSPGPRSPPPLLPRRPPLSTLLGILKDQAPSSSALFPHSSPNDKNKKNDNHQLLIQ